MRPVAQRVAALAIGTASPLADMTALTTVVLIVAQVFALPVTASRRLPCADVAAATTVVGIMLGVHALLLVDAPAAGKTTTLRT